MSAGILYVRQTKATHVVHSPKKKTKLKSEVSLRMYQAHTGTYVKDLQLKPNKPYVTKETIVQIPGEQNRENKKREKLCYWGTVILET